MTSLQALTYLSRAYDAVADPGFGRRGGPKRFFDFHRNTVVGVAVGTKREGGSQVRKMSNMLHCLSGAPPSVDA